MKYKEFDTELDNDKVDINDYFDNVSHHLLITPYLKDSEYIHKIKVDRQILRLIWSRQLDLRKNLPKTPCCLSQNRKKLTYKRQIKIPKRQLKK